MGGNFQLPGPLGIGPKPRPPAKAANALTPPVTVHRPGPLGARPTRSAPSAFTELELAAAEEELELLRKVYTGVLDATGKVRYVEPSKTGFKYRSEKYLADRNRVFGSSAAFRTYLATAREELDAKDGSLRKRIEPPLRSRTGEWKAAQDVFYAWVRRMYETKVEAGTDIAALIRAGNSEQLKEALRRVKVDYPTPFSSGGFNPRPIKTTRGYRLGTISDHALGTAIDIESGDNAQIEPSDWRQLCLLAGEPMGDAVRKAKWKEAPEELHAAIVRIHTAFVSQLETAVAEQVALGVKKEAALGAVHKSHAKFGKLSSGFLTKWHKGFFHLPWELVKALHAEGFRWGAVFGRVDLHHFEL